MTDAELEKLRYPVGRLDVRPTLSPDERSRCIDQIQALPAALRSAVTGLDEAQLDTPYRAGGWTIRQVVHHLPDSHMNSYVRFKLGATEDSPTITTYEQGLWAEEADNSAPVDVSLRLLEALHERWVLWLRAQESDLWTRTIMHPELGALTLEQLLQVYCWHSHHHLAHINGLKERKGWA